MLTLFSTISGRHLSYHTALCKFLWNISANIWSLGNAQAKNLEKCLLYLSSLTSQFLHFSHLMVFDFFLLRDIENNLYLAGFIKANWNLEMLVLCTLKYDSLHVHVEAKLQNTGPLLTMHQTSRLVWLVCSYTHINYSSFYPLPSQTSQTSH